MIKINIRDPKEYKILKGFADREDCNGDCRNCPLGRRNHGLDDCYYKFDETNTYMDWSEYGTKFIILPPILRLEGFNRYSKGE